MGLKKIIFEEQNFDDLSFKLWKVDIPFCRQNEKLIKLNADCFNIKKDLGGLEMKDTDNIDIFKLFLNNDEKSIHILVESCISFKICTKNMKLVQNDVIINNSSEDVTRGSIKFMPKGFKIIVNNELEFSSFKEFIQQTKSDLHKKSSKENLKVSKDLVLIHLIKYLMNLFISRYTFMNWILCWTGLHFDLGYFMKEKLTEVLESSAKTGDLEAEAVPEVGNREIQHISDGGMYVASVLFAEEFAKVVPIVFAYPGRVDGKDYIIAVLHPGKKSDVHLRKVPAKFKGFPVIIGYGAFKPLSCYRNHHDTLSSGVSIGDLSISSTATLGETTCTKTKERYIHQEILGGVEQSVN
ncbi:hypothetical protein RclHR1_01740002 [Rhizophagus clarus]|uniref:Uncharacterized protein n=1 Tax=Rhizophagus clarus TaxID=94130 RepID=A0A2Z6QLC3_9GLOM|nr:hypothetical protein RclHR1_01740002 [Rhizophagus clarus]GET02770.1 hypothetical protein GLOIN_2v1496210 [Rhizophagus clarus]